MKGWRKHIFYRVRQVVQVLSFTLFVCLLIYADPLSEHGKTVNYFLRLSPLSAIGAMVASREVILKFWPSLIVLISSIFLGRYFCSWMCPFGTTIDITDKLFSRKRDKREVSSKTYSSAEKPCTTSTYNGRQLKYYILAFLILSLFFTNQMVGWIDPLSLANNTYTIIIHPYSVSIIDSFFYFFYDIPLLNLLVKPLHEGFKAILFAFHPPLFRHHYIFLILFTGIVSFGMAYRRYWCRNLCPLGALFALLSERALFKRVVSEDCTLCRQCIKTCGMGAINNNGKGTLSGECTLCLSCQKTCPVSAVQFKRIQPLNQTVRIDLSRRRLLTAGLFSIASLPILNLNLSRVSGNNNPSIIRPPGAITTNRFTALCVRCGECMRICKTNGLHPVVFEDNLANVWTPTLVPRLGYCDYECILCGMVCPTGAIKQLELAEKQALVIGKARINQSRCIPWVGFSRLSELKRAWEDVNCGVCEEVCPIPIKAIRFDPYIVSEGKEIRRVFVVEDVCIGCGFCEKVCPVPGIAAIRVEGIQPQLINQRLKGVATAATEDLVTRFFPDSIGTWVKESSPVVYKGRERLFEYIDGGADPYLSYSFIQVAICNYLMKRSRIRAKVDIWEFACSDDAYGVFSKDRAGDRIALGDEGAIYDNYLWMWKGRYFIAIEPQEGYSEITMQDVITLGDGIVSTMPRKNVSPPHIVNLMPLEGLFTSSVKFFHEKIILDNIYISNKPIKDNIFILNKETDAVIGEYKIEEDGQPMKLMIVKYPDDAIARQASQNLIKLRNEWGGVVIASDPIQIFVDSKNQFCSVYQKDNLLISTFFAPSSLVAEEYINKVLGLLNDQ